MAEQNLISASRQSDFYDFYTDDYCNKLRRRTFSKESPAKGEERYTCVNLTNDYTIEFRMFRGTLKLNTLISTLQLIDRICDCAVNLDDEEIKDLSWTTFVSGCAHLPELVQYLKERRLYINEPVTAEAEV